MKIVFLDIDRGCPLGGRRSGLVVAAGAVEQAVQEFPVQGPGLIPPQMQGHFRYLLFQSRPRALRRTS